MNKIILIVFVVFLPLLVWGQKADSAVISYQPKVWGMIKGKWEYCFEDNTNRFDLKSSRIAVSGNINPLITYRLLMEYGDLDSKALDRSKSTLYLLDAFMAYSPSSDFTAYMGQIAIPFSEDYVVSPSQNIFANRSFVAKFINPSTRDLGVSGEYHFGKKAPFTVFAGVYNGTGINNPVWHDSPFLLGRLVYGTMEGFRGSIKYYGGKSNHPLLGEQHIANYGIDARYARGNYRIEAEWVIKDSLDVDNRQLSATYLQGAYIFPLKNNKTIKYIEPTLRGDAMGYNVWSDGFDVSRVTVGLNFGFDVKQLAAELRINYEHFFLDSAADDLRHHFYYSTFFDATDKRLFNKLSIEFLVKF